ncbi:MAG: phage Gp37/Gp68 family protein [Magnetococcales bacterium]|nr:phage Gp37/Gp68 family protein [Magnetococcales bacterium]
MADHSDIEWTEATWNPVTGCTKMSLGCRHCYAERMAYRLQAMGNSSYLNGFQVTTHPRMLDRPMQWKTPRMIFVNSMSDLFHEEVPESFIRDVFTVMGTIDRHRYQALTKRSDRLLELSPRLRWTPNIWMGVTVENASQLHRLDHLRRTGAALKFVSIEPLLGSLGTLDLRDIDWVIVGGESGPGARPMEERWVLEIRDQCLTHRVPFFFKQWGGVRKKKAGRLLQGVTWDEMPRSDRKGAGSFHAIDAHSRPSWRPSVIERV